MKTNGIHHVTAVASDAQRNFDFYTRVLGLRLVKRTVNFDDPTTYHLYFGDEAGSPGTIITFFPWPGSQRGRNGAGYMTATGYLVPLGALDFWATRLAELSVPVTGDSVRFGQRVLTIADSDGSVIELIESDGAADLPYWQGAGIDAAYAIRGFHSATLVERSLDKTAEVLTAKLGFEPASSEGNRHRFRAGNNVLGGIVDVVVDADAPRGAPGAGIVHHVAFRAADDAEQARIHKELVAEGRNVSPIVDRSYFHSIYFREPGGVLFEIATDAPGMAIDEPLSALGDTLRLPPQYEPHRAEIERVLPALEVLS
jgi:glyoxalase family protein